jgi:amino acid adenylation domain-containing protein
MADTLQQIDYITKNEKQLLLETFNDTNTSYPEQTTIIDLFQEQVKNNPKSTALVFQDKQMTYKELDQKSNQLAQQLIKKGVQNQQLVPICTQRSMEMIIGILGILKAGAAYVPIDPDLPNERIQFILKDTKADILVSTASTSKQQNLVGIDIPLVDLEDQSLWEKTPKTKVKVQITPNNLAYVIYTSGSTGTPKGVLVEHASLHSFLLTMDTDYSLGGNGRLLLKTTYTFDVSLYELFGWIKTAATLVIMPALLEQEPKRFIDFIQQHSITHLTLVPSLFAVLLEELSIQENTYLSKLKYIFLAGEALPGDLVKRAISLKLPPRLINIYGPTESTVYSSHYNIDPAKEIGHNIPIGKPLNNIRTYILSEDLSLLPIGAIGELCLSGAGLARGYLNREQLTKEKFIQHPFRKGERLYKTGDLARWLPDGNIEFIGRKDDQVKIRGYRIELGEIQHHLDQDSQVEQSVVMAREDHNKNKYLVGYLIANNQQIDKNTLKEKLAKALPNYMVPQIYVELDHLPLTTSGKIDKKALPAPEDTDLERTQYLAPSTETEHTLVALWENLLGVEKIGVNDNFFELGGNSITAIQLISEIRNDFDLELSIKIIFKYHIICELGKFIDIIFSKRKTIKNQENTDTYYF